MNESFGCRGLFLHLFYVGQEHNAKYFCPGEPRSNAAKYKPLTQYGEAKRGRSLRGETEWVQNAAHNGRKGEKHKKQRYQTENKRKENQKTEDG